MIYNLEAEQSVLGSILMDATGALPKVIDVITAEDFYIVPHRKIYTAMLEMYASSSAIDFVTLSGKLGSIDGETADKYLLTISQMVPSIANAGAYADIVAKSAKVRKVQRIFSEAEYEPLTIENVDEVAEKVMSGLHDETTKRRTGLQSVKSMATDWYTNLFKTRAQNRIDTGYGDLDAILKGMWDGNLILLAARPGIGKSAFASEIAKNAAKKGKTVDFYSLEMEEDELLERMVSAESSVDMDILIEGDLKNQQDIAAVAQGIDSIYKLPLNISDDASITPSRIRAQSRMTKNLGLIVVDYLQLIQSAKKTENRNQEVGAISRELKLIANDLKVPILALSQLNRDIEKRGNKQPTIADLRDSGELEQNANKVMLMWEISPGIIAVDVAKNRRGRLGQAQLIFDGSHMRYSQLVKSDYVKPKRSGKINYENEFEDKPDKKGAWEHDS